MQLSIDQALEKAVQAHKAGRIQEADQLYTAILKAQPKHPDANHNLGVLAVSIGKVETAVPLLKSALESNSNVAQFWLSYIDALIKLNRTTDAQTALDQAKRNGAMGDGFDKLEQQLKDQDYGSSNGNSKAQGPSQDQVQSLIKLYSQDQLQLALERAETLIQKYPKSAVLYNIQGVVLKVLGQLEASASAYREALTIEANYAHAHSNMGVTLQEQGKLDEAISCYKKALTIKPDFAEAHNNMGNALQALGKLDEAMTSFKQALTFEPDNAKSYNNIGNTLQKKGKLDEAIFSYKRALSLKPEYAEAYNNLGITLKGQGKLEEAIEAYKKALAIKPEYAEAYNNMGVTCKEQGKLEEAIEAYSKALDIKPEYAETHNNMGVTFKEQGKLAEAIEAYSKALAIKPGFTEPAENSQSLAVQLLPITSQYGFDFDAIQRLTNLHTGLSPKNQIHNAIKAYLEGDFRNAKLHNNKFRSCDQNLLYKLKPYDIAFCIAYSSFLGKLLDDTWDEEHASENILYHLGESHSLSYAHRHITLAGLSYKISPRITFGAKAFHFSRRKQDAFKSITKAHLVSLPQKSKVFVSFGEIDCRPNEGFISAASKHDIPLEELIEKTTEGYVNWFLDQNADQKHNLYFLNVPAPVYNEKLNNVLNLEVAKTVALFNTSLKKYTLQSGFALVDVYKFTAGQKGYSNGLFHMDRNHLATKALPEIERLLSRI